MDRILAYWISCLSILSLIGHFTSTLHAGEPDDQSPWRTHDITRPRPAIVTPSSKPGQPPSDAVVLFDGTNTNHWESTNDQPTKWAVADNCLVCSPDSGPLKTKKSFGDVQFHAEWSSPSPPRGKSQGRGNSGIYFMSKYEVQILDSYENETYADGQAAALYGQNPPLANVCRPSGEWQSYDVIFRRPHFADNGTLQSPAIMTVIHNGVVVQDHFELWGPTNWLKHDEYRSHPDSLPITLQDHGNPVRFRNIWLRELPPQSACKTMAHAKPQVALSDQQLDRLTGKYGDVKIRRSGDVLQLKLLSRYFDLVPQSKLVFELKRTDGSVTLVETNNKVTSMKLELMGSVETKVREVNDSNEPDGDKPIVPNAKPSFDASSYVGLTEAAAVVRAEQEGRRCRVLQRDDQSFPATRDYRPNRVNLTVKNGKVTKAYGG